MFTELANNVINGLGSMMDNVLNILPTSPFRSLNEVTVHNQVLQMLAWVVPFPQMIALGQAWVVCVMGYYIVMKGLRWAKMIQ